MPDDPAVRVSGLSKVYKISHQADRPTTAAEVIVDRMRHPLRRHVTEKFAALDNVSFEVEWGEAVGIIGRNGAGKSTLLKILTRVTAPSAGRVELGGRVGSLLEVGTGFHPELTGRENVVLNGTLLGMRRKEIKRRFDEIVDFSGVEQFLDTPVKRYSSGMYVRLAFSVAAHLESEILAIDEVLAVGDAEFQSKCLDKMREVTRLGRTVLFVSHQIQSITTVCTSALYLEHGRLVTAGTVGEVLDDYKASFIRKDSRHAASAVARPGSGELRALDVRVVKDVAEPGNEIEIEFVVGANPSFVGRYFVSCHIVDAAGTIIVQCDSRLVGYWLNGTREQRGRLQIKSPWLRPGDYRVDLFLCKTGVLDSWEGAAAFQLLPILPYKNPANDEAMGHGLVLPDFSYMEL